MIKQAAAAAVIALASTQAQAGIEICETLSDVGRSAMEARQSGEQIRSATDRIVDQFGAVMIDGRNAILQTIAIAYNQAEVFDTQVQRDFIIDEFENIVYATCVETLL